jgi:uncharacterized protein YceH (UPF0502 family)
VLSAIEGRVLGCLLEKERITPDQYPLSLNALVAACNQSTSRDPVTDYAPDEVETAARSLKEHGLARLVHPTHGRGVVRYRQVLDEKLHLDAPEVAALTVLLLRGPQTVGEIRTRTERLHHFGRLDDVDATLRALAGRGEPLVRELERRAGHHETRWVQLLVESFVEAGEMRAAPVADGQVSAGTSVAARLAALEERVRFLEDHLLGLSTAGEPPRAP